MKGGSIRDFTVIYGIFSEKGHEGRKVLKLLSFNFKMWNLWNIPEILYIKCCNNALIEDNTDD